MYLKLKEQEHAHKRTLREWTDLCIWRFAVDNELWFSRALKPCHFAIISHFTPCVGLNGAREMEIQRAASSHGRRSTRCWLHPPRCHVDYVHAQENGKTYTHNIALQVRTHHVDINQARIGIAAKDGYRHGDSQVTSYGRAVQLEWNIQVYSVQSSV